MKNMGYNQLIIILALIVIITSCVNTPKSKNCSIIEVPENSFDLSNKAFLQMQLVEIKKSTKLMEVCYISVGVKSIGYRLSIDSLNNNYELFKFDDKSLNTLQKGNLIAKIKFPMIERDKYYESKCGKLISIGSIGFFLVKKNGYVVTIYAFDNEIKQALNENRANFDDFLSMHKLLISLIR